MIKKSNILYSVTKPLSDGFVGIPVYALDKVETVERDAFYVDIITVTRESEAEGYIDKRFTIDILYKLKKNDNKLPYMDVEDKILDQLFINYLTIPSEDDKIKDRKPHIFNQLSNVTDNVLHCMFDIQFIDELMIDDTYDLMGDLRVKFKLVEEVINPHLTQDYNN